MEHRIFGHTGASVSVIGQGTWNITAGAAAALRQGLDLGMTHIDTAELYDGAEAIVARAIEGRRDEIFLVSKVLPSNASRAGTIAACERSLARLRTDRLDAYLLHWPGSHKLEETIAAFEHLVSQGKIRAWGLSNFDVPGLELALRIAGPGRIACNQILYHLQERAIEHAVLPWCTTHNVAVVAYSPFGSGNFPAPATPGGKTLAQIASAHNATPRQVALAFLTRNPNIFAIPKAATPSHATENAAAPTLHLTPTDLEALNQAFPRGPKPKHLPMI